MNECRAQADFEDVVRKVGEMRMNSGFGHYEVARTGFCAFTVGREKIRPDRGPNPGLP